VLTGCQATKQENKTKDEGQYQLTTWSGGHARPGNLIPDCSLTIYDFLKKTKLSSEKFTFSQETWNWLNLYMRPNWCLRQTFLFKKNIATARHVIVEREKSIPGIARWPLELAKERQRGTICQNQRLLAKSAQNWKNKRWEISGPCRQRLQRSFVLGKFSGNLQPWWSKWSKSPFLFFKKITLFFK